MPQAASTTITNAGKITAGERFGRLVAIEFAGRKVRKPLWRFRCDCGNEIVTEAYYARTGHTRSCGCMKVEEFVDRFTTHGKTKTPEYKAWCGMIDRCHTPTNTAYVNYGGRGIRMCARWRESFEAFLSDVGPKPSPEHSLDRIDNDGNYEPGNVRWATRKEQANNRRRRRWGKRPK